MLEKNIVLEKEEVKELGENMGNISYVSIVSISRQYKQAEIEIEEKKGSYSQVNKIIGPLKLQV